MYRWIYCRGFIAWIRRSDVTRDVGTDSVTKRYAKQRRERGENYDSTEALRSRGDSIVMLSKCEIYGE